MCDPGDCHRKPIGTYEATLNYQTTRLNLCETCRDATRRDYESAGGRFSTVQETWSHAKVREIFGDRLTIFNSPRPKE